MKTLFINEETIYTGKEIESLWTYKTFQIKGDSIVSFIGEANVKLSEMVDMEDVINKEHIYSPLMLHFIIEVFDISLPHAVALQRLFIAIIKEYLHENGFLVERNGDDLFYEKRKLSVSIATKNIVSCKIHTGINIETERTPIPTAGLKEMGVDYSRMGKDIIERFKNEYMSIKEASVKVRGTI